MFDCDVDPNNFEPQLHMLPHEDYNMKGEYIHVNVTEYTLFNDKESNRSIIFTEQVTINNINPITPITPIEHVEADINFWVDDEEYLHGETITRCIKSAMIAANNNEITATPEPRVHTPCVKDYKSLKPYFSWIPTKLIKEIFKHST